MTFYVLLLICLFFGLLYLLLTQPAQKSAAFLMNIGPFALIAIGAVLTFARRGALGLPLIFIGVTWWRRTRTITNRYWCSPSCSRRPRRIFWPSAF